MTTSRNQPHDLRASRPEAAVPQGRARRFASLATAAAGVAAGAAADSVSRLARGEALDLQASLFTPGNARRLAERLSTLRGAVMKLGQLLSMDGQSVLPPAFAELLSGLRERAHSMPATQLAEVLEREYGANWHSRFRQFSFQPIASASIGQVHRAETADGHALAIKLQYPGVRESIDSDVANLALLARLPGLVPAAMAPDVQPLLEHVRTQLLLETDYAAEARLATEYRQRLGPDPVLQVPEVHAALSTAHILAMDFAPGRPIEQLNRNDVPQRLRDQVATALCRLAVREIFDMQLVQTDPNFGNYLFDEPSGKLTLLDFGATQHVTDLRVRQLRALGQAVVAEDLPATRQAALALQLIDPGDDPITAAQTDATLALLLALGEPLRHIGVYDFARSTLVRRVFDLGQQQLLTHGASRPPPADLIWLQRKFVGTFLLCARLRARVDLTAVFGDTLKDTAS